MEISIKAICFIYLVQAMTTIWVYLPQIGMV